MPADLYAVAVPVLITAAGLCVVVVVCVAGLLWVRSIAPQDIRFRLDRLEAGGETLKDELRRMRERVKTADRRAAPGAPTAEANQDGQEPADGTAARLDRLHALRAQLGMSRKVN